MFTFTFNPSDPGDFINKFKEAHNANLNQTITDISYGLVGHSGSEWFVKAETETVNGVTTQDNTKEQLKEKILSDLNGF